MPPRWMRTHGISRLDQVFCTNSSSDRLDGKEGRRGNEGGTYKRPSRIAEAICKVGVRHLYTVSTFFVILSSVAATLLSEPLVAEVSAAASAAAAWARVVAVAVLWGWVVSVAASLAAGAAPGKPPACPSK